MEKVSVVKIKELNEAYKRKRESLDKEYDVLKKQNSLIDLNEVKENLSYEEAKELYKLIQYSISSTDVKNKFSEILKTKKIEEYPDSIRVRYYPAIKKLKSISEKDKILLDKTLKDMYKYPPKQHLINDSNGEVIKFLIEEGILERQYVYGCKCNYSFECNDVIISQKEKDEFYKFHNFDIDSATDKEIEAHLEQLANGVGRFYVDCWHDGGYEVCDIDDFEENLSKSCSYKVLVAPDMTLDNI